MSRNPLAAPIAMWFRSIGLMPRLVVLDRNVRVPLGEGKPGEMGVVVEAMTAQVRPPSVVLWIRFVVKWKKTRPVASRPVGAATTHVENGAVESLRAPRGTWFW